MNQSYAHHQTEGEKIIGGLMELVNFALTEQFPRVRVDLNDVEQVIDALHALGPESSELWFLDGLLQVARGDWQGAAQTFRDLVDTSTSLPFSRGMLMYALQKCGDPQWRFEAQALCEGNHADVSLLAQTLIAGEDMRRAVAAARRTGRFDKPDSVLAMEEARERLAGLRAGAAPARADAAPKTPPAMPLWAGHALRA
jgi:type III secretion protein HrpB1